MIVYLPSIMTDLDITKAACTTTVNNKTKQVFMTYIYIQSLIKCWSISKEVDNDLDLVKLLFYLLIYLHNLSPCCLMMASRAIARGLIYHVKPVQRKTSALSLISTYIIERDELLLVRDLPCSLELRLKTH